MSIRLEFQCCKLRKRRGTARADGSGQHKVLSPRPGQCWHCPRHRERQGMAVELPELRDLTPKGQTDPGQHREVTDVNCTCGARRMFVQLCMGILCQSVQHWSTQEQLQAPLAGTAGLPTHSPLQPSHPIASTKHPESHRDLNHKPGPWENGTSCCWRGHRALTAPRMGP